VLGASRESSDFRDRTRNLTGELGVLQANSILRGRAWSYAGKLRGGRTLNCAGEINKLRANSEFCRRTQHFAGELVVLRAHSELRERTHNFASEHGVLQASSNLLGRAKSFARELGVFAGGLRVLQVSSAFCGRSRSVASNHGVLKATLEFCGRNLQVCSELYCRTQSFGSHSKFYERTREFAGELRSFCRRNRSSVGDLKVLWASSKFCGRARDSAETFRVL